MPISTATPKVLAPGIYCPTVAFFRDTSEQELDLDTFGKHMEFLARSGVHGVVVQGSTAEAVTLDREERKQVGLQPVSAKRKLRLIYYLAHPRRQRRLYPSRQCRSHYRWHRRCSINTRSHCA